jgi:hypothetical protein
MLRKFLLIAAVCGLVASQAAVAKAPVQQARDIELVMTQQELAVDVPNTGGAVAAGVGGILGVLIGAAINNAQVANGEKRVAEMRNQLLDYRFNQRFEQAFAAKLAAANLANPPKVEIVTSVRGADELKAAGAVPRTYALVLSPRYAITSNFEDLSVTVNAMWLDRSLKTNGKVKQKFHMMRTYAYRFPMEEVSGSGATEDSQRWVALGGAELSAMLDKGIDEVAAMVVYDLTPAGLAESQDKKMRDVKMAGKVRRGRKVEVAPGQAWLRNRFMLEGFHPIDGSGPVFSVAAAPVAPVAPVDASAPAVAPVAVDAAIVSEVSVATETAAAPEAALTAEAPVAVDTAVAPEADVSPEAPITADAPSAPAAVEAAAPAVAPTPVEAAEAVAPAVEASN